MDHVRTWAVQINITEHDDERRTRAEAILQTVRPLLRGEGEARRRPSDREIPEIGAEFAVARALADLAYKLLDVAAADVEQSTRRPAHLTS
jgi:Domain of unknown function (DUF1876)